MPVIIPRNSVWLWIISFCFFVRLSKLCRNSCSRQIDRFNVNLCFRLTTTFKDSIVQRENSSINCSLLGNTRDSVQPLPRPLSLKISLTIDVQLLLKIGQNRYKQVPPPKRRWTDNDDSTISLRNEQELMVARLTIFCGFSEKTVSGFGDRECDSKEKWIFCAKLHDSYGEVTWNARPSHQGEKFQKNNYYAMCELCDNRVCKQMITTSSTRCCAVRA